MSLTEITQLPLREKLQIMEALWDDLSKQVERFEIPREHLDLLDVRRAKVAAGESTLHDWDSVKYSIGRNPGVFISYDIQTKSLARVEK